MPDIPIPLFLNPTAGRGRAGRRLERLKALFGEQGVAISVFPSQAMGDIEAQVARHVEAGAKRLIVAGGDGSIHEAVNGLLAARGKAALGVIPIGTGNDFAKACGITLDWQGAGRALAQRIAAGSAPRKIDVGRMNERYFANGVGIGFDAKVTRVARGIRWPIGDVVYLLAILRCLYDGVATPELRIESGAHDEELWHGPLTMASINNGDWVGGMFHIAPMAGNADGRFDLVIAGPVSRPRILALLPKLIRGTHLQEVEILHRVVQSVRVHAAAPIESHLDGEVQPLQTRFDIAVLPGALDLL